MEDDDPFYEPKLLLARAKENSADFHARAQAYADSHPYEVFHKIDAKTGNKIVKLRLTKGIGTARAVFSDAVNNIRHALDQAVNSAAVQIRGGKRDCYFPFAKDETEFVLIYKSTRYRGIPEALRPFLRHLQPYGGGDDVLYALNRITGPNKHQAVLAVEPTMAQLVQNSGFLRGAGIGLGNWDGSKNEVQIAIVQPGGELNMNFNVTYAITLRGSNALSGQHALAVFDDFFGIAERIVLGIEAETARILRERAP